MKSSIAAILALALAVTVASNGAADPAPPSPETGLLAPAATGAAAPSDQPRMESFPVPGSGIHRVRATVAVNAPIDRVRTVIFDYARYPEFMPLYQKASVLQTTPAGGRLVQMQLGGIIHLWMRVDISAPMYRGTTEAYDGRLVAGNVKAFQPRWELEPLATDRTRVTVESFLDPDLPLVPSVLINSGTVDGIREAILALKARIEGRRLAAR
jgi:ribosome-associated toxin RatA of RatAB toxin-antitoxin module